MGKKFWDFGKELPQTWKLVFGSIISVTVVQSAYILGLHLTIIQWWDGLSDSLKQNIIFAVIVGLVIGIISNLISPTIRNLFSKRISRGKHK